MNKPWVVRVHKDSASIYGLTRLYLCDTWLTRLQGVFFRKEFNENSGVLLRRCSSVHGFGLSNALDVVFLGADDIVLSVQTLEPNSVCSHHSAESVLEVFSGTANKLGIYVGDKLDFGALIWLSKLKSKNALNSSSHSERGASMVEFILVAPVLIFIGMGIVQMGLAYHARNVLDYATFEAARAGAVHQADISEIRKELAYRMGAIFRGDGSYNAVRSAVQEAAVAVNDPIRTQIKIINPTSAAFEDFGVLDPQTGDTVLPNSHLQHRSTEIGTQSGVTIQDANLLKIEVTHGYELKFPWFDTKLPGVDLVLREVMTYTNPENAHFYLRGQIPIKTVATVRMQSMAKANNVLVPNSAPTRPETGETNLVASLAEGSTDDINEQSENNPNPQSGCVGEFGLPVDLAIEPIAQSDITNQCAIQTAGLSTSSIVQEPQDNVNASPVSQTVNDC